jgi:hypothetical protein
MYEKLEIPPLMSGKKLKKSLEIWKYIMSKKTKNLKSFLIEKKRAVKFEYEQKQALVNQPQKKLPLLYKHTIKFLDSEKFISFILPQCTLC